MHFKQPFHNLIDKGKWKKNFKKMELLSRPILSSVPERKLTEL